MIPKLTEKDLLTLRKLMELYPIQFYQNVTKFFIGEMYEYIRQLRIWRLAIMGEPRAGKSESGQTICLLYRDYFNKCLKEELFEGKDIVLTTEHNVIIGDIDYNTNFIYGSSQDYINAIRLRAKNKEIKFGQIHHIDENKPSIGGLGSYSEMIELNNINNITAKFMQSEIWLTPVQLLHRNTPYGIIMYKRDNANLQNWGLLYKADIHPSGVIDYIFIGWVCIPLHNDNILRSEYEIKKNGWIMKELEGGADTRMIERKNVSKMLAEDDNFSRLSASGKQFQLSRSQQIGLLENLMISGRVSLFNEVEKIRIVDDARAIVTMRKNEQVKV